MQRRYDRRYGIISEGSVSTEIVVTARGYAPAQKVVAVLEEIWLVVMAKTEKLSGEQIFNQRAIFLLCECHFLSIVTNRRFSKPVSS